MALPLYGSRPAWGAPDFSPFVIKLETWLRMAGIPYERRDGGTPMKAPKGKLPYVELDGKHVGDSQLVLEELTRRHGVTLDAGMSPAEAATARAVRRMLEEGTYFCTLRLRWLEADGWAEQYPAFAKMFPAFVAPIVVPLIRNKVRSAAQAQGVGRHTREEVIAIAAADLAAVQALLGEQAYLFGDAPRSVDATLYAFLTAIQTHPGTTAVHLAARSAPFLAYTQRIRDRYWA